MTFLDEFNVENYSIKPIVKFPIQSVNIQRTLEDHLPEEFSLVNDKIILLTNDLKDLNDYKRYLTRIAEASEIRLASD